MEVFYSDRRTRNKMKSKRRNTPPKDGIPSALPALKRAAKAAWRLSVATNTPFYIYKDDRVINLNTGAKTRKSR